MTNTLKLASIPPPEPDFFELPDGRRFAFRMTSEASASDMAMSDVLSQRATGVAEALSVPGGFTAAIAAEVEEIQREFIHFILPDLPADVVATLKQWQATQIIDWWRQQMKSPAPTKPAVKPAGAIH